MSRLHHFVLLPVLAGLVLSASIGYAAVPKIGDKAPDWSGIVGIDDKEHGLADYKKAKAVVVVFTCNHCPVAVAYEDRLVALQKDYKNKGVQLVAINVNNIPADRLEPMKVRAKQKKFNFPYLYDSSQKSGKNYGAVKTPHVFLLDKDRKLVYVGAIDDSMKPDRVKTRHLRDALDAVLAGKPVKKPETIAVGCGIQYEK